MIETGLPSSWSSDASVAVEFASGQHLESSNGTSVVLVDTTSGARNAISIRDFPDTQMSRKFYIAATLLSE